MQEREVDRLSKIKDREHVKNDSDLFLIILTVLNEYLEDLAYFLSVAILREFIVQILFQVFIVPVI